jgi:hypothetical protein
MSVTFFSAIAGSSFGISSVGIATGYRLYGVGSGVHYLAGSRDVPTTSRPAFGSTQPPLQYNGESSHRVYNRSVM